MNEPRSPRLGRVPLPNDPRAFVKFPPEIAAAVDKLTREAVEAGRWQTPEDVLLDMSNGSWAYWLYKSANPIVRAMPGSGIEEALRPFRRTSFELTPPGFTVESQVTMSASGDLMCTKGLDHARDRLYEQVADLIFGADIAFANLESTLTTGTIQETTIDGNDTPKINLTPAQYDTISSHKGRRFDVFQLSNNHILDCGDEGVETTLARLRTDGIEQVGVNETEAAADEPRILQLEGLRIGWVAHTFSVNFKPFPPDKPWRVNMTPMHLVPNPDVARIEEQVRACRQANCDLVFVSLHWGLEFEFFPHPDQRTWARRFAEAGADVIIGHHPHVPQAFEIYRPESDPPRSVPILYSLGNLTSVVSHPSNVLSLVARLQLSRGRLQGTRRCMITALELTPVVIVSEQHGVENFTRLVPLASLWRGEHDADMSDYVKQIVAYADLLLGEGWRDGAHPHR